MSIHNMRVALGVVPGRISDFERLVLEVLDDLDGVLMMTDADVRAARGVIEVRLRDIFDKVETQRKRISYLESRQPAPKKPGPKKAPARPKKTE